MREYCFMNEEVLSFMSALAFIEALVLCGGAMERSFAAIVHCMGLRATGVDIFVFEAFSFPNTTEKKCKEDVHIR